MQSFRAPPINRMSLWWWVLTRKLARKWASKEAGNPNLYHTIMLQFILQFIYIIYIIEIHIIKTFILTKNLE